MRPGYRLNVDLPIFIFILMALAWKIYPDWREFPSIESGVFLSLVVNDVASDASSMDLALRGPGSPRSPDTMGWAPGIFRSRYRLGRLWARAYVRTGINNIPMDNIPIGNTFNQTTVLTFASSNRGARLVAALVSGLSQHKQRKLGFWSFAATYAKIWYAILPQ